MLGVKQLPWSQYGVAVVAVTVAILLTQLLYTIINPTSFQAFYVAVATSAWLGGLKPGLLASILSALCYLYFFTEPFGEMSIADVGSISSVSFFFLTSQFVNFLGSSLRQTKHKIIESIKAIQKSEDRLNRLTKTNLIGIFVAEVDGAILEANDAFLQIVGYTRDDLCGDKIYWRKITPPEYLQVSENSLKELQEFGQCQPFEKEYICKDGSRVPILINFTFFDDSQKKLIGYVLDISDRKQAETNLREKQELFNFFMNNSPMRAYIKDATGRYIYVNQVIEQLFDWQENDWLGKTDFELLPPQIAQQFRQHDLEVLEAKQGSEFEEIISIDDEKRYLTSFKFPFKDASRQQFLAGMSFDITEEKWNRSLLTLQRQVLTMVARGTDLSQILETLMESSEQLCEEVICAVLLPNHDKTQLNKIIAPSLPIEYKNLIKQGVPVSDRSTSCGRAVHHRRPIIVKDIANDPDWQVYREIALKLGLRGSWSIPILSSREEILGTLVMYYPIPREPNALEHRLIDVSIYLAGLAIERHQAEDALTKSEERFRKLVEKVRIIPWEATKSMSKITYVGSQAQEILGYPLETWYADDFWKEHLYRGDREWVESIVEKKAKTLSNYEIEYRVVAADGRIVWIYDLVSVFHENGQPSLLRGFMVDITQQKQSEEAQTYLAQASQILSKSLDYQTTIANIAQLSIPHLADGCIVYVTEEDGSIQPLAKTFASLEKEAQVNQLLQKYPVKPHELYGVAKAIRQGRLELYQAIYDEWLVAIARDREHLQLLREIGFSSVAIVPMIAREKALGAIAFIWSESARQYTQSDLILAEELAQRAALAIDNARIYRIAQRDRARAEMANRLKDEFLATLSHELRTPLNAILGWTQMLAKGRLNEEMIAKALEIMNRNSKSLTDLVENLLDASQVVAGQVRLNTMAVDLRSLLQESLAAVRPAAKAKEIQLDFVCQEPVGLVSGDPDRLQQVFWNLLSNAIKFTPNGGQVELNLERIEVTDEANPPHLLLENQSKENNGQKTEKSMPQVKITITDTGIGISPEFLSHVFERFRQADSSTTRFYGGLGLGLAIVRHFVELHGGTVTAESPGEGQGAKFIVCLPAIGNQ
jgi:PAS domain S-box-containing protein